MPPAVREAEDGAADMTSGPGQRRAVDDIRRMPRQAPPAGAERATSSHAGRHSTGDYSRARAAGDDHAQWERVHAARTVASNAHGAEDLLLLLSILGLDAADDRGEPGTGPAALL
jgi:hypothetical protein